MGYACPVCDVPQRDGEHLAHHLAFTAMIHGDDHEAWLDERVDDWAARDPDGLAAEVTPHADDAEYHEVFEDTTDRGRPDVDAQGRGAHGHADGHDHADAHGRGGRGAAGSGTGSLDAEAEEVMQEARELTREMYADDADGDRGDDADDGDDGGSGDADPGEGDGDRDADRDDDHDRNAADDRDDADA